MGKRKALIAGNWKMHTTVVDGCQLAVDISSACTDFTDREVLIAPPYTILSEVSHILRESQVIVGSQNVCWEEKGAFTGEISPVMVKGAGGSAALVGHSERRHVFGETDEQTNKKTLAALDAGLKPILCVGETEGERDSGETEAVVAGRYEVHATQATPAKVDIERIREGVLETAFDEIES